MFKVYAGAAERPSATSLENAQDFRQVLVPSPLSPLIRLQSCGNLKPKRRHRHSASIDYGAAGALVREHDTFGVGQRHRAPPELKFGGPTPAHA